MSRLPHHMTLLLGLLAASPGTARSAGAQAAVPTPRPAEVAFMRGMIQHHAQAVTMAALVPSRTATRELRLLAERIDVSQQDEMARMRRWLAGRGLGETDPDNPHAHHHRALIPGMLGPEELAALEAATGPAFDRRFLEGMITHHQGALTMVADLVAKGGAQDPDLFQFASDVDTDQRMEISRMTALLARLFPQ